VTHSPDFARRLPRRVRMVDGIIQEEPAVAGQLEGPA
jgi:hypothetical protein